MAMIRLLLLRHFSSACTRRRRRTALLTLRRLDRRTRHRPLLRRAQPCEFLYFQDSELPEFAADPRPPTLHMPFHRVHSYAVDRRTPQPKTAYPSVGAKMSRMCSEASRAAPGFRSLSLKGPAVGLFSKAACRRPPIGTRSIGPQKMREAFKDDLEYIERDITLHGCRRPQPHHPRRRAVNVVPLTGGSLGTRSNRSASAALLSTESTTQAGTTLAAPAFVYIIDTGINPDHVQYADRIGTGFDFFVDRLCRRATTATARGSRGATAPLLGSTFGVAPRRPSTAFASSTGDDPMLMRDVIAGMRWVADNHALMHRGEGARRDDPSAAAAPVRLRGSIPVRVRRERRGRRG